MTYISQRNFEDFGITNNLAFALNSIVTYVNTGGFSTIGIRLVIPTGATVVFEGTHDGAYFPLQVLDQSTNSFVSSSDVDGNFLCPSSALRTFRVRVSIAGSVDGTVVGRAQRDVSIINAQRTINIDDNNSSDIPLTAGSSFIGDTTNILGYNQINISIFARPGIHAGDGSNAKASVFFEFSSNGINWDVSIASFIRDPSLVIPVPAINTGKFFRVRYLNDGGAAAITAIGLTDTPGTPTSQTDFRLVTYLLPTSTATLVRTLEQTISDADPVALVRSVLVGKNPDQRFINAPQTGTLTLTPAPAPLGISGVYTSDWFPCDGYIGIGLTIKTNQLSAVDGILIEFSEDQSTIIASTKRTFLPVDVTEGFKTTSSPIKGSFLRIVYTNAGVAQGAFLINIILTTIAVQLATEIVPLSTWTAGQATISSATVAVNVIPSPNAGRKSFAVKLLLSSTKVVYVGPDSTVSITTGHELSPGESIILECDSTAEIWVIGVDTDSQTLSYVEII